MTTAARDLPGVGTLFASPHAAVQDLRAGDFAYFGVPYDLSSDGLAGARHGPQACREASQYYAVFRPSFEEITTARAIDFADAIDLGDAPVRPLDWGDSRVRLTAWMHAIVGAGAVPVGIGGDYFATSVLAPAFATAVAARGGSPGFLRFSGRLDVAEEHASLGVLWHGRTTRTILESGAFDPARIALMGASDYIRDEEWAFAMGSHMAVVPLDQMRASGPPAALREVLARLNVAPGDLYVSIDLDVIDGAYVPNTDEPVFDGLTNVEFLGLADMLNEHGFGALDVTGLNPHVEPASITGARFAAWMLLRLTGRQRPLEAGRE